MILFAFFIAFAFIHAFPNIVTPAISELTSVETIIIIVWSWIIFENDKITLAPPAPLKIPQISPTTSAQKEHTFSELSTNKRPISAPFLSFAIKKSRDADVTAIPTISKQILTKINVKIVITEVTIPREDIRDWLIKLKTDERHSVRKNILTAHPYCFTLFSSVLTFFFRDT